MQANDNEMEQMGWITWAQRIAPWTTKSRQNMWEQTLGLSEFTRHCETN
jgi:hypothetical protein